MSTVPCCKHCRQYKEQQYFTILVGDPSFRDPELKKVVIPLSLSLEAKWSAGDRAERIGFTRLTVSQCFTDWTEQCLVWQPDSPIFLAGWETTNCPIYRHLPRRALFGHQTNLLCCAQIAYGYFHSIVKHQTWADLAGDNIWKQCQHLCRCRMAGQQIPPGFWKWLQLSGSAMYCCPWFGNSTKSLYRDRMSRTSKDTWRLATCRCMKSSHKLWLQLCTLQWATYWSFIKSKFACNQPSSNFSGQRQPSSNVCLLVTVLRLRYSCDLFVYCRNGSDSVSKPETKGVQSSLPNMWLSGASNSMIGCSCGSWKRIVTHILNQITLFTLR